MLGRQTLCLHRSDWRDARGRHFSVVAVGDQPTGHRMQIKQPRVPHAFRRAYNIYGSTEGKPDVTILSPTRPDGNLPVVVIICRAAT